MGGAVGGAVFSFRGGDFSFSSGPPPLRREDRILDRSWLACSARGRAFLNADHHGRAASLLLVGGTLFLFPAARCGEEETCLGRAPRRRYRARLPRQICDDLFSFRRVSRRPPV